MSEASDLIRNTVWLSPKNHEWVMESLEVLVDRMFQGKSVTKSAKEAIDVVIDPLMTNELIYLADDAGRVHKILIEDEASLDG